MRRALALGLSLVAARAWAADPAQVLKALEESGRALKTMKADFVETKVSVLLDETTEQQGRVLLQVPGRFRWDYTAPSPGTMVIKDGQFARYVPQSKQVFRGPAKGEADLLVGFGPGAAGLSEKYDVMLLADESVGGSAAHVLDLLPKKGQAGLFAGIRLWVDKARSIPIQTRLTEPTGDYTTVRFTNVQINAPLGASAFELKLPKDVVEVK